LDLWVRKHASDQTARDEERRRVQTVMRWTQAGKIVPALTLPGRTGAHLFSEEVADAAFGGWQG